MKEWIIDKAEAIGDRKEQQDRVTYFQHPSSVPALLVVSDGVGGHQGGALASATVEKTAERLWHECGQQPDNPIKFLEALCDRSHQAIQQLAAKGPADPRATIVALLIEQDEVYWTHVGDSRLYRFRNGQVVGRTRDHSVLQILVDQGKVSEEEMGTHPDQGKLLQSLGGNSSFSLEVEKADRNRFDSFLLCTDGFWERIQPAEMAQLTQKPQSLEYLQQVVNKAVKRSAGKSDNVAVVAAISTTASSVAAPPQGATAKTGNFLSNLGREQLKMLAISLGLLLLLGTVLLLVLIKPPINQQLTVEPQPKETPKEVTTKTPKKKSDKGKADKRPKPKEPKKDQPKGGYIAIVPPTIIIPDYTGPPLATPVPENPRDSIFKHTEWVQLDSDANVFMSKYEVSNRLFNKVLPNHNFMPGHGELPVTAKQQSEIQRFCEEYTQILRGSGDLESDEKVSLPFVNDFYKAVKMEFGSLPPDSQDILSRGNIGFGPMRLRQVQFGTHNYFPNLIGNASELVLLENGELYSIGAHIRWKSFDLSLDKVAEQTIGKDLYPFNLQGFRLLRQPVNRSQ